MIDEYYNMDYICSNYKWANGFTEVKMNKLQRRLGDGGNYGMMWIMMGVGFFPSLAIAIIITLIFSIPAKDFEPIFGLTLIFNWFGLGLFIEYRCYINRLKIFYNKIIKENKQMNLFRDFGIEQSN